MRLQSFDCRVFLGSGLRFSSHRGQQVSHLHARRSSVQTIMPIGRSKKSAFLPHYILNTTVCIALFLSLVKCLRPFQHFAIFLTRNSHGTTMPNHATPLPTESQSLHVAKPHPSLPPKARGDHCLLPLNRGDHYQPPLPLNHGDHFRSLPLNRGALFQLLSHLLLWFLPRSQLQGRLQPLPLLHIRHMCPIANISTSIIRRS